MKGKKWNENQHHIRSFKTGKNWVFFIIHQILEKTEWHWRALEDNGTAKSERSIHVHFPSVDEHVMHPTGDISFDILLVVIKQPMLTHFAPVSYKWFCC